MVPPSAEARGAAASSLGRPPYAGFGAFTHSRSTSSASTAAGSCTTPTVAPALPGPLLSTKQPTQGECFAFAHCRSTSSASTAVSSIATPTLSHALPLQTIGPAFLPACPCPDDVHISRSASSASLVPLAEESFALPAPAERVAGCQDGSAGLKSFEYPTPVVVKNTFINAQIGRPPSLEGFFEERRVHSWPGSPRPAAAWESLAEEGGGQEDATEVGEADLTSRITRPERHARTASGSLLAEAVAAAASAQAAADGAAEDAEAEPLSCRQVLLLTNALKEPELGTPVLPTVGSASHRLGNCKPCAFAHTKGCGNGVDCQFCHLCEPGEKKRRQKEKFERRRQAAGQWHDSLTDGLRMAVSRIF